MKHQNASKVIDCIDKWNRVRQFSSPAPQILTQEPSPFLKQQHFFEQRKMRIILMKGPVRVSGQKEYIIPQATSSSSISEIEPDQKHYNNHPPPSNPSTGISQILTGVDDDVYRLFIVPLS